MQQFWRIWPYLIIAAAVLVVFGQVVTFDFVSWDDPINVTNNPNFLPLTPRSLVLLLARDYAGLYVPVTYAAWALLVWLSSWTVPEGRPPFDPALFHGLNLVLFAVSGGLLYALLRRLAMSPLAALAGTFVFLLHPLQVESVAWVTELKGQLSTLFSLAALCLIAASHGDNGPGPASRVQTKRRGLAYLCFVLALLSKPAAVTVPLAVAAVEGLALRRPWRETAVAVFPWFVLAAAWVLFTRGVQPTGEQYVTPVAWLDRPLVAGDSLAFYCQKLVAPLPLSIDYGRTPQVALAQPQVVLRGIVAAGALLAGWLVLRDGTARAGLVVFAGSLLPVLGFVPFQFQRASTVADRYAFFALVGVALMVAAVVNRWGRWTMVVLVPLLAMAGYASWTEAAHWRNSVALYRHTVAANPRSAAALTNLGAELERRGDQAEAEQCFRTALSVDPLNAAANADLAAILVRREQYAEAAALFDAALRHNAQLQWAHAGAGLVRHHEGRTREAAEHYRQALQNSADGSSSLWQANRIAVANRLARVLATDRDDAVRNGREAVRFARDAGNQSRWQVPGILDTVAAAHAEAGQFDKAVAMARRAVERALAGQDRTMAEQAQSHLQLFEAGQPLRESPREQLGLDSK